MRRQLEVLALGEGGGRPPSDTVPQVSGRRAVADLTPPIKGRAPPHSKPGGRSIHAQPRTCPAARVAQRLAATEGEPRSRGGCPLGRDVGRARPRRPLDAATNTRTGRVVRCVRDWTAKGRNPWRRPDCKGGDVDEASESPGSRHGRHAHLVEFSPCPLHHRDKEGRRRWRAKDWSVTSVHGRHTRPREGGPTYGD